MTDQNPPLQGPQDTLYQTYGKDLYRLPNPLDQQEQSVSSMLNADPDANNSGYLTMPADAVGSGVDVAYTEQGVGTLQAGQRVYDDTKQGYFLGLEDGIAKLSIGSSGGNKLTWDGTTLTITGSISAGSITGATITGGTIRTAASGQRVEIESVNNTLTFYNSSGTSVVQLGGGTDIAKAIRIDLDANTTTGIAITSAVDATTGIRIDSSSDVTLNALRIALTNTGSGNDGYAAFLEQDGTGFALDVAKATSGTAVRVTNTGTGTTLELNSSNASASHILVVNADSGSHSNDAMRIDSVALGIALNILHEVSGSDHAIKVLHGSSGVSTMLFDKNSSGAVIEIDQDVNNSAACYGLSMSLSNAGSGLEYAFDFQGSEKVNAAVGGSQDYKIRVRIGATDYFIPCYTA